MNLNIKPLVEMALAEDIGSGDIPAFKAGGQWRFDTKEIKKMGC